MVSQHEMAYLRRSDQEHRLTPTVKQCAVDRIVVFNGSFSLRFKYVPHNEVSGILVIIVTIQVLSKYMTIWYLDR